MFHKVFQPNPALKEFVNNIMVFQEDFDKIFEALEKVKEYVQSNPPTQPNRVFTPKNTSNENPPDTFKEEDLSF